MTSINKVILIGRVVRDPEVRYTASGGAICNLSVATTRTWKDKNSGQKVEEPEWHKVTLFESAAESAGKYLVKGSRIYIEGRLKTRKWTDKEGRDNYVTEIVCDGSPQFLDSKKEAEALRASQGRAAPAAAAQEDDCPF
jgi:single-strand DNA-binding protein